MRWTRCIALVALTAIGVLTLFACSVPSRGESDATDAPSGPSSTSAPQDADENEGSGVRKVQALVEVYSSISPMIDTIIVEYDDEVVLPDVPAPSLYAFSDGGDGRSARAVYTNDEAAIRPNEDSVPGRFVIMRLQPEENPRPEGGMAWRSEHEAGRAVLWGGSRSMLRLDYSDVSITQNFDAADVEGAIIRSAGNLPQLQYEDISWPQLAGFSVDSVLEGESGDIHYSFRLPEDYDPAKRYPMMISCVGYNGLLLSQDADTRGVNIYADLTAVAWSRADKDLIVVAPQLTGWDDASARQAIELTEHFLRDYAIDQDRVYASGYSAGGETLSRVMGMRPDLFAAYVHGSSQWDGGFDAAAENRLAVYIYMARNDGYYGQARAIDAYERLRESYKRAGAPASEIDDLLVLDVRDDSYFNAYGLYSYHAAGMAVLNDPDVVQWILRQ